MNAQTNVHEVPQRLTRCRYLRMNDQLCTAEAADPEAEVLLCIKHLARALAPYEKQIASQRNTG